ncbi:hypothetical protein ACIQWA_07210 [Kitasatospora sp. NPDC098652]|uniref:hypothetical protein n=1 Tax=Kitasatospora sp. NPDC098652 TaxID=3364095 RepID=UPI0038294481
MLTLTQLSRAALAERLKTPRSHVEAVEHVIMAKGADSPIGPVELSRRLACTSAIGTEAVNRLVTEGHLTRVPTPATDAAGSWSSRQRVPARDG